MAAEITMPRLSDSMEEGVILRWLVAEGDEVELGQELVEVETDKATVTHEADAAGVVLALTAPEGATVPVGAAIAVVGVPGEERPRASAPEAAAAATAREGEPRPAATAREGEPRPAAAVREGAPGPPVAAPKPAVSPSGPHSTPVPGRVKASPLARRLAAGAGVALAQLTGSGPHGRVIRADVERAMKPGRTDGAATSFNGRPSDAGPAIEPLSRLQRTVARRMAESRAQVPDIELRMQVDMSETVALREQLRALGDTPPSYNDFVVKAAAIALRAFPRVNGAYSEEGFQLFSPINVGIAVAAEDALLVPVVPNADRKPLGAIARETRELAGRARGGSITPAELEGGTFTVSNLGMYGVDSFSAVINQPQAAILTVGALAQRPVVDAVGAVVARPTIVLTLVCDHRILYGADGARFLSRVRELLEHPLVMLVD